MIQKFDEHSVAKHHKFGVVFQRFGQVSVKHTHTNQDLVTDR